MNLSELVNGESAIIVKLSGSSAFRKRLTEMGFVRGKRVSVIKNAPLKDPIEYRIMGYNVSLRRSEASLIEVADKLSLEQEAHVWSGKGMGSVTTSSVVLESSKDNKNINVVLIGNPNSGKTSLFNYISGLSEHVGNYSGVTVDKKDAVFQFDGYTITITDLPGTYSLSAYSPEEMYVRKYLNENKPDVVINVVDASNIERNLYLTTQLIDMEQRIIVALNMYDELEHSGDRFDYKSMGQLLNIPFIPTVAKKGRGVPKLLAKIVELYKNNGDNYLVNINYGLYLENCISDVAGIMYASKLPPYYCDRFTAIKLIEDDEEIVNIYKGDISVEKKVADVRLRIKKEYAGEDCPTVFADARYGFISGALKETYVHAKIKHKQSEVIDTIVTHKLWGFPIFIFIIWFMFYATFTLGEYPMMGIEYIINFIQKSLSEVMQDGAFKDLMINGIIGGVGSVIVFLPNILLLFLFISVLEDSGYMARAAFIMDKLMHKIGLHGKSFIPLIMGFGCNVPAIMASRIVENKANRILTILIIPFMSCSARLPVYILIVGAFFPDNAGNMLFLIYLIGIAIAIFSSLLFKKVIFKGKDQPFVMELPPYRVPSVSGTLKHTWHKGSQYLSKMGGVILVAVVVIWTLSYYPQTDNDDYYNARKAEIENIYTGDINEGLSIDKAQELYDSSLKMINTQKINSKLEASYLGRIGKTIEPVIAPLGFDWKIGVCLLSGIAAKEIIVSTMGVINQVDTDDADAEHKLETKLRNDVYTNGDKAGTKVFNKAVALSFLMFVLIYFPCIAVISAIKKETEKWRWALFTMLYTTTLAWVVSFMVFQIFK